MINEEIALSRYRVKSNILIHFVATLSARHKYARTVNVSGCNSPHVIYSLVESCYACTHSLLMI